jgi:UDP-3-O-[3-hydroxymyristoyl] glucosamine N-acyltransferase
MKIRRMNIRQILEHDPSLELRLGRYEEFESTGPFDLDDDWLLTYARNKRFVASALSRPNVAVLFARPEDAPGAEQEATLILTQDPQAAFFAFHNYLATETDFYGASQASTIAPSAKIYPGVFIAEQGVSVGDNTVVYPGAVLLEGTTIEAGVEVGPGVVLGVSGARIVQPLHGAPFRIIHIGGVLVRQGAFLGANCVIVRSVWRRPTTIGRRTFVGNLANVGHNCVVGDDAMLLPGSVLCGSTHVGDEAVVAPGATVANQKTIGRGARITLGAVVTQDVEPGSRVSGNFAIEHEKLLAHVKELSKK